MESLIDILVAASIYVPAFLFVLTIIVFFHELGHFIAARWCGVTVEAFSIGFGKEIWGWTDRKNTRWKVCWIPLGGYVKFIDDANVASTASEEKLEELSEEQKAGALQLKPLWQRAVVVAAGPVASFLLAIFIFAGMFMAFGYNYSKPVVGSVIKDSPAEKAGFKPGDVILSINSVEVKNFRDIKGEVTISGDELLKVLILRGEEKITIPVRSKLSDKVDEIGDRPRLLGITSSSNKNHFVINRSVGPITAIGLGVRETYGTIALGIRYLTKAISKGEAPEKLNGPLGILDVAGKVAINFGFLALIQLAGAMSAAIGFFNLLPIPLLDGGHLAFYAIEAVRGKPLSEQTQEIAARVGFVLLIALMIFVTRLDIINRYI